MREEIVLSIKMTFSTSTIKDKSYLNFMFSDSLTQEEVFKTWKMEVFCNIFVRITSCD